MEVVHDCYINTCARVIMSKHHGYCLQHVALSILLVDILYHRMVRCFPHQSLHLRNRCQLVLKVCKLFARLLKVLTLYFAHLECLVYRLNCLHFLQSCEHLWICRCLALMEVPVLVGDKLNHFLRPHLTHSYQQVVQDAFFWQTFDNGAIGRYFAKGFKVRFAGPLFLDFFLDDVCQGKIQ